MCTPTVSEDCLYLNIYTPALNSSANLSVIFWIHGGDYREGSGGVPLYDGQSLVNRHNIVVVTINYRLGAFAGLYIPGVVKGNFASKDQRVALLWVKQNIKQFGGNPARITIAGQSSGAFSVAVHLASPISKGLFQGAMMASNPLALPTTTIEVAANIAEQVMKSVHCPPPPRDPSAAEAAAALQCLQSLPASAIDAATEVKPTLFDGILHQFQPWAPVFNTPENPGELPISVQDAFTSGAIHYVPILMGTVANETVGFIRTAVDSVNALELYTALVATFGAWNTVYHILPAYRDVVAQDSVSVSMDELVDITTDYIFYCPQRHFGALLASHRENGQEQTPVHMYHFNHLSSFNKWIFEKYQPYCVDRICHSQDLPYYFDVFEYANVTYPNIVEDAPKPSTDEKLLIKLIQTGWGNFAKTGNPNLPSQLPYGINWGAFSPNADVNNLVQQNTPSRYITGYKNKRCDMWDRLGYKFNLQQNVSFST